MSRTDSDLAGRNVAEQHNARSSVAGSVYQPTFDAVLALAKEGRRSAFEEFFVALNRPLHAFCLARGSTDGEGTVNEVFLKVFKNVRHFNGTEDQFRSWVFTIARNQLVDDGRRAHRRPVESGIGGHDDWVGATSKPKPSTSSATSGFMTNFRFSRATSGMSSSFGSFPI